MERREWGVANALDVQSSFFFLLKKRDISRIYVKHLPQVFDSIVNNASDVYQT